MEEAKVKLDTVVKLVTLPNDKNFNDGGSSSGELSRRRAGMLKGHKKAS
jgi:hypothetical protein